MTAHTLRMLLDDPDPVEVIDVDSARRGRVLGVADGLALVVWSDAGHEFVAPDRLERCGRDGSG